MFRLLVAVGCLLVWANFASAVVVENGDGTGNTSAPADDPGFANVGTRGVGTAIYLGNRWVLTAAHLRPGTLVFGETAYTPVPSETVRIENPEGLSAETDILLLRLPIDPGLPSLRLPCGPRQLGAEFTMIGQGHDREPAPTFWNVDENAGVSDDVWTEVNSATDSNREGFLTLDDQTIRWGIGSTGLVDLVVESDQGDVMAFASSFVKSLDVDGLAQAVRGDSGGAGFQKNLGVWELIGLIFAVDLLENQPGATRSAIYGNTTLLADLFQYSDAIRAAADFEPNPGDLNGNGQIEASEIDFMLAVQNLGDIGSCHSDVNGDGTLSPADVDALLVSAGTLMGDADLDGTVAFSDFLVVSKSFGTDVSGWANGDFDADGRVGFADFLELSGNFGASASSVARSGVLAVPEPRFHAWHLIIGLLLFHWWRAGK